MISVILFGESKDTQIAALLRRFLAREHTVCHLTQDRFETLGSGPAVNLVETASVRELSLKNAILIVKQNAKLGLLTKIGRELPVVIDAANVRGLARLDPERANVYTCGYSPKDAITFSSREETSAVVSLQRTVRLGKGGDCEPFELPCVLDGKADDYSVLASAMGLILMRLLDENIGRESGKIYFSY